jgi:hypothetical protein
MHHTKQLPAFGAEMPRWLRNKILYDHHIKKKEPQITKTQ